MAKKPPCPPVPFWNLTLRFGLEIAALVGLTMAAWGRLATSLVVATPIAAGAAWATFNVPGDSSRSGNATVPVPGPLRLIIEFAILFGASWALMGTGHPVFGSILGGLVAFHYVFSMPRVQWLLGLLPTPSKQSKKKQTTKNQTKKKRKK